MIWNHIQNRILNSLINYTFDFGLEIEFGDNVKAFFYTIHHTKTLRNKRKIKTRQGRSNR